MARPARRSTTTKSRSDAARGVTHGYRSGLEGKIAQQLRAAGLPADYETITLGFTAPAKQRRYTPDFPLPNGIVIETKGRFFSEDRVKHKQIKAEHPSLDIRFVFSNSESRLTKVSKTTYAMWCDQYGFLWANQWIPEEWLSEPPCPVRISAILQASK